MHPYYVPNYRGVADYAGGVGWKGRRIVCVVGTGWAEVGRWNEKVRTFRRGRGCVTWV